jgi:hypothetical protein
LIVYGFAAAAVRECLLFEVERVQAAEEGREQRW